MLQHTSVLADYEAVLEKSFVPNDSMKQYILGNNEILKFFYETEPALIFHPGEQWEYSNTGYMILETLVEKISSQHFSVFLKKKSYC